jgi:hypothetical protein
MTVRITALLIGVVFGTLSFNAFAWDHPGHMTTADIAFAEIERVRPELIEKLGLLFLAHPDPCPFWVAAREARGEAVGRYLRPGPRQRDGVGDVLQVSITGNFLILPDAQINFGPANKPGRTSIWVIGVRAY